MENYTGLKEALEWVYHNGETVKQAETSAEIINIDGVKHVKTNRGFEPFNLPEPSSPDKLNIVSLEGLIDFVVKDPDGLFTGESAPKHYAMVRDQKVTILTRLHGRKNTRSIIAECEFTPDRIPFGEYIEAETMFIMLQTRFVQTDARDTVMKVIGNLKQEQNIQTADDGISQRFTIKSGISTNATTVFKNPVPLKPYRTFLEVEQVESPFVLRIKEGGKVALFDADGGMWKLEARRRVREYLDKHIGDKVDTVI
jgi:hypothetical protein